MLWIRNAIHKGLSRKLEIAIAILEQLCFESLHCRYRPAAATITLVPDSRAVRRIEAIDQGLVGSCPCGC
jgi:hypothetical protein